MENLKVRDLMTENVYSIQADEDLDKLNELMGEIHVRHVPVVDGDGDIVGLVSQRDLIRSALDTIGALPKPQQKELLGNTKVSEIMVSNPETADPDMDIVEAGRIMLDNKWGCLPVSEGNHLIGILTEADFIKYVVEK